MTRVAAESRLSAWETLQMTGVSAKNAYQPDKLYKWPEQLQKTAYQPDNFTKDESSWESRLPLWQMLQIIGIIAENSLPAWET